jgi:hypothetical protein
MTDDEEARILAWIIALSPFVLIALAWSVLP